MEDGCAVVFGGLGGYAIRGGFFWGISPSSLYAHSSAGKVQLIVGWYSQRQLPVSDYLTKNRSTASLSLSCIGLLKKNHVLIIFEDQSRND